MPYVHSLLSELKRINDTPPNVKKLRSKKKPVQEWEPSKWVFSSPAAASGHIEDPHDAHNQACAIAGLTMTLYGLEELCNLVRMDRSAVRHSRTDTGPQTKRGKEETLHPQPDRSLAHVARQD
jgi:hypothetical protein